MNRNKPYFIGIFAQSAKLRALVDESIAQCLTHGVRVRTRSTSRVEARAHARDSAKTLVFLPRWCNPNAVFAIPAGTLRHRHSLMARRAAWRRSVRRRRSQRRKRALGRPSAGRRSKRAPLVSLRLRTTSMTASHGSARVELREAHRARTATSPGSG